MADQLYKQKAESPEADNGLELYWPQILRGIREFQYIAAAENPEIRRLWQALGDALEDQFVHSATENGVSRWETILTIVPKGTETLEERKFRILTRLNEQLPYSYRMLCRQLETLCGPEGYRAEIDYDNYKLIVKVALTAKANLADVDSLLQRVAPANLIIELTLLYNQHSLLATRTHGQLAAYTFAGLRNEVIT